MGGEGKRRSSLFGTSSETETMSTVRMKLWKIGSVPIRRRQRADNAQKVLLPEEINLDEDRSNPGV
jgi:hypothetical protein